MIRTFNNNNNNLVNVEYVMINKYANLIHYLRHVNVGEGMLN